MSDLSLRLLGPFEVHYNGERLTHFRTHKVQALLAYLIAEPPVAHQREALMALLWPNLPPDAAQTNLRQIIYQLRKAIPQVEGRGDGDGRVPFLLSERLTVGLHPAALFDADTTAFDSLLHDIRRHDHSDVLTCPLCGVRLAQAATLYQGAFLADFYLDDSNEFEHWANSRRATYHRRAMDALATLAQTYLRRDDHAQAQATARRQLELDDLDERACRQLMEAQARAGRRNEAAATYEVIRRRLRDELGMSPSAQTARLAAHIAAGQPIVGENGDDLPKPAAMRGYKLLDELGVGAFGRVYRAYQPVVGRQVAIKIIRPRYANHPDFIRRFETEAQLVARLEHPYIVPLYDYWREPDNAYLVMRWLPGGSLAARSAAGPQPPVIVAGWIDQIAAALLAAHRHGVIHRDVKAANILLDEDGNAYLSDFSLAREMVTGGYPYVVGSSPAIVSPEQLLHEPLSPQTDQYNLAVVAYQMLTGGLPFATAAPPGELRRRVLDEPLPPVAGVVAGLPAAVDGVLRRATAQRPADRFPDIGALAVAFRQALEGESAPRAVIAPAAPAAAEQATILNPYKGLRAFEENDAAAFFGREALVRRLVERLAGEGHGATPAGRFLGVVGPSGSGKSSLVRAGLLPALRRGAVAGAADWFITEMIPGSEPFEELAVALRRVAVDPPVDLVKPLRRDERGLARLLRRVLPANGDGAAPCLLLVIDQFEELFTLTEDAATRQRFIGSLLAALGEPDSRLRVVVTLRADFYDRPLEVPGLGEMLRDRTVVVLPMSPVELEQAITQPAASVGIGMEAGLPAAIITAAANQPGSLPLVQYALTELFDRRENGHITSAAYEAIGGVSGALDRRADEIFDGLDPAGQEAARQLFLRLVTLGEGVEDTRRRVLRAELEALILAGEQGSRGAGAIPPAPLLPRSPAHVPLDAYGRARLLTFDRDPATRGPTVEVAHEALLREWGRLRSWLDESRADVRLQRLLAGETAEWLAAGRGEGYLLRGSRLDQFQGWPGFARIALTGDEQAFLDASLIARRERRTAEEARRQRELATARQLAETERRRAEEQAASSRQLRRRADLLAVALAIAALLAVAAALLARSSGANAALAATRAVEANANAALAVANANLAATRQVEAEEQTRLAVSRELTQAALNALATDSDLGILLALRALDTAETKEAQEALHRALQATRTLRTYAGVTDIIDTPDGPLLVSVGEEAVTVRNPDTAEIVQTLPHEAAPDTAYDAYVSLDGNSLSLLSWPADRSAVTIQTWDLADGRVIAARALPIQLDENFGLALSPDGQWLAVGYEDGTAELWDARAGRRLFAFAQSEAAHDDWVWSVVFDGDGRRLATISPDGQVFIWDVAASVAAGAGQLASSLFIPADAGRPRAFTFVDGDRVAAGTHIGTVQLWDLNDPAAPLFSRLEHNDIVDHLAFDAERTRLVSASGEDLVNIRDMNSGDLLLELTGPVFSIFRAHFTPDGTRLVTLNKDGAAHLWDIRLQPLGELGSFTSDPLTLDLELSPTDGRMATGSEVGPPTLWDPSTGERLQTLDGPQDGVWRVAYSPDGTRLAGVGREGLLRVWDLRSGEIILTVGGHGPGAVADGLFTGIMDVAYSPDGTRLATAGADGVVVVRDAATGEEIHRLTDATGGILTLDYSPDGRLIAAATYRDDGTVRVWDAATGEQRFVLRGHRADVWGVAFSPDSSQLVSTGNFGIVKGWEMATGEELYTLSGIVENPFDVEFTPDGQYFVTAGPAVHVWRAADGAEMLTLYDQQTFFLTISDDGRLVYVVDIQDTVQILTLRLEDTIALAHERLSRWWRPEECRRYLHTDQCPPAPAAFAAD